METDFYIAAGEFCSNHDADVSFLNLLHEAGLIEIKIVNNETVIPASQLTDLEKIMRLYYDLEINLQGIESILYLQSQMHDMNQEIIALKNRLRFYEDLQ